jgi:glycosyltransferase involved in cell wall biosynthesis
MTVVQLCGWYFPDSLGGTETYVAALAEGLRAAGHTVSVAAPEPGAREVREYEHDGVRVFRYPVPVSPKRAEARHDTPVAGVERLHAWLRTAAPDVVHVHTFVTGVGPHEIQAARAAGARVVVTTHSGALGFLCQRGSLMHRGRERCDGIVVTGKCAACALEHRGVPSGLADAAARVPGAMSRLLGRLPGRAGTLLGMPAFIHDNRRRQHDMLGAVDAFVVLTDWARAIVSADAPDAPVVVNRLGVRTPPPARSPRPYQAPVRVAYVGRFDEIKGVFDLARALRAVPDLPIRFEFRGPQRSAGEHAVVARLRAELAGDSRVTIADAIAPERVYDYLGCVDVLCSPSVTLEGGPTVALEAMAAGVPVIATRLGAMAELLTDGVNTAFVAPGDWRALADVLSRIAADPDGTIGRWRTALPPIRTMADVTQDYLSLYDQVAE